MTKKDQRKIYEDSELSEKIGQLKMKVADWGNQSVTICNGLKMLATDGKMRMTDVAYTEQLVRLNQFVLSPKATMRHHFNYVV